MPRTRDEWITLSFIITGIMIVGQVLGWWNLYSIFPPAEAGCHFGC